MIELITLSVLTWFICSATIVLVVPILLNWDLRAYSVFDVVAEITNTAIYFNEINHDTNSTRNNQKISC